MQLDDARIVPCGAHVSLDCKGVVAISTIRLKLEVLCVGNRGLALVVFCTLGTCAEAVHADGWRPDLNGHCEEHG